MTALAKLEDWKAPWEVDSTGTELPEEDQKIDPARLKKYLHGLLSDKERLQTTVTTVTGERDELKTKADEAARKGETDEAKAKREAQDALKAAEAKGGLAALKLDVALDVEGITPAQAKTLAKSLSGETREALEEHAKELSQAFNIGKAAKADDEDEDDDLKVVATRPRRPKASADPEPDTSDVLDVDDLASINKHFPRR